MASADEYEARLITRPRALLDDEPNAKEAIDHLYEWVGRIFINLTDENEYMARELKDARKTAHALTVALSQTSEKRHKTIAEQVDEPLDP